MTNIHDVLAARDKALVAVELSKQALVDSHNATELAERMTRAFTDANDAATTAIAEYARVQALYEVPADDALAFSTDIGAARSWLAYCEDRMTKHNVAARRRAVKRAKSRLARAERASCTENNDNAE